MATIPTTEPKVDDEGYIPGGKAITLNETVSAVNKNEPLFGVGNEKLMGYIALEMYEQHQASVVSGSAKEDGVDYELFEGDSYSSGKPFVIADSVWAANVI